MTNWDNATLAAWFGAQNGYLDMAAMRPDPPCEGRQRDGPGTYHLHLCGIGAHDPTRRPSR
jgi:hypothetical protein